MSPAASTPFHGLRDLGIKASMDDFGTGYCSLSYLRSFPFDKIKIDQSFVRSGDAEKNSGIISAITAMGRHLGMLTIAEGVETVAQLGRVTDSGGGSVQGFLISRPVAADEGAALFARLGHGQPDIEQQGSKPIVGVQVVEMPPPVETGLHRQVYYSRNTIFGLGDNVIAPVDQILATSQRNNVAVGVTGALIFTDGYFAQVLEGPLAAVEQVFERFQLDDCHTEVQLLSFGPVETRLFPNWAMAFVGKSEPGRDKFGHYPETSEFDFGAADGNNMVVHLRALLVEEEGPALKIAA